MGIILPYSGEDRRIDLNKTITNERRMLMVKKSTLLYIIGAIIYIACFGYIVSDLAQTNEGRILIFIYSTSIILTTVIICLGYKISKALLGILDKYTNTKV